MFVFTENNLRIYVLDEPEILKMYKTQFDAIWKNAEKTEGNNE